MLANLVLFVVQLHIIDLLVRSQHGSEITPGHQVVTLDDLLRLPYPYLNRQGNPFETLHVFVIVVSLLQVGVFFALWRALLRGLNLRIVRLFVALSTLTMFAFGLWSKSLASPDIYAYIGYGKLGFAQAYSPTREPFTDSFGAINTIWGLPQTPCVYGPLWLVLDRLVLGPVTSLAHGVLIIRVAGACAVGALALALSRLPLPRVVIPMVVLNPAIIYQYVVNAHNDLLGVVFAVFAVAAVASAPLMAALLIACAGLVKLSLIGLTFAVFRPPISLARRLVYVSISILLFAVCSVLFGGTAYVSDVLGLFAKINTADGNHHPSEIFSRVLELLAIIVLLLAFVRGIVLRSGAWSLLTMSAGNYPWYFIWGLPYAVLSETALIPFLIFLPLVTTLVDSNYRNLYYETFTMAALCVLVGYDVGRSQFARVGRFVAAKDPHTASDPQLIISKGTRH